MVLGKKKKKRNCLKDRYIWNNIVARREERKGAEMAKDRRSSEVI
jgi:hypothetical protein